MTTASAKAKFLGRSLTGHYRPTVSSSFFHPAIREGRMMWHDIPAMLLDPHIQIGLRVLAAPISRAKWKVKCNRMDVGTFIHNTLQRFWNQDLPKALQMVIWGTVPGEVLYEEGEGGRIEFKSLRDFRVTDTRPQVYDGEVIGLRVVNLSGVDLPGAGAPETPVKDDTTVLREPRAFWLANESDCGSVFGKSRLSATFGPWMEKAGKGGARDIRKLWMFKNAFTGGTMYHPEAGEVVLPDGKVIAMVDYAMQIVEKAETGHVMAVPSTTDEKGNRIWEYKPATINGDASEILEYPDKLGNEIWLAMGIMPEVIQAAETGSGWSGRSVPFLTFLTSCDGIVRAIIAAVKKWIIEPLVQQNFGDVPFDIEPESLVPKEDTQEAGEQKPEQAAADEQPADEAAKADDANADQATGGSPQSIMGADAGPAKGPVRMSQLPPTNSGWVEVPQTFFDLVA